METKKEAKTTQSTERRKHMGNLKFLTPSDANKLLKEALRSMKTKTEGTENTAVSENPLIANAKKISEQYKKERKQANVRPY